MEVFSLEDEDYGELFITQESKENVEEKPLKMEAEEEKFLGNDPFDFTSPCVSICDGESKYKPVCEDISDGEFDNEIGKDE